ncbi:MAG: hypothetical protein IJ911_00100 [Salinivirgaceae bacterium]|nr:hypothetical protein [Salinivirgaceae bacterium]
MRKILNYGLVACLTAAFVFAGCKKDDDEGQNAETQNILPKKVSKIVETVERTFEETSKTSIYIYYFDENGKLIKDESFYNGELEESVIYQYTENSIKYDDVTCNVEKGRISQLVYDEDETTVKFNYSADGYLASYLFIYEYKGETYSSEMKYTYENGNVVELENKGEDYIVKYSYGQTLNNLNVDLFYIYEDLMPFTGYFGKRVKNLPSSMVGMSVEDGKTEVDKTTTFTYIYDGEYLTKIEESQGDDYKRTYEIFY